MNVKNVTKISAIISLLFFLLFIVQFLFFRQLNFEYVVTFLICSIIICITSFLFVSPKHYYKCFILVFLSFLSVLYIVYGCDTGFVVTFWTILYYANLPGTDIKFMIAFYTGITNIFLFLSCFFNKNHKILSYIIRIVMLFPTLFIWQYFFISDNFISVDTILAIFQTNFSEIKYYIYNLCGIKQYVVLFLALLIFWVILKYTDKLEINNLKQNKVKIMILIISIVLNILLVYRYKNNIVVDVIRDTNNYLKEYNNFKKSVSKRKGDFIKLDETENINKGIYVLVLGESQNKKHMSAYGYNKQTTPWLDNMEKSKNFIKFTNVYSCHVNTVPALFYALTSKNQYNNIELSRVLSILDVANTLCFKTVWLSNQHHYGIFENPISIIADIAQTKKWLCEEEKSYLNFDDKLVDKLKKLNFYDNMLIIIHLMGSHEPYKDRYPTEFNIFKDNTIFSQYDNTIFYNDYVMKNIFNVLTNMPNFKVLIYCADHADAIDDGLDHDPTQFVPSMTYIPLYLYLSDSYIKDNLQIYMNLYNHRNYYFTNDLLFNLLLGILNIRVPDIYEQNNDITNEGYDNNINRFKTLHGNKNIADI